MSGAVPMLASDKLNLERIHFLLVDDNSEALNILRQIVTGFGARLITKCSNAAAAREVIAEEAVDFVISDGEMPNESGYSLVRWIRREASEPNRFVPAIILTGHTRRSQILQARDCGAHFIVAKPLIPAVLLERIFWVARDERMFIDSDTYKGPDRRFKKLGPPPDIVGRRSEDRPVEASAAAAENLAREPQVEQG